jgi:hypothetical protein
MANNATANANVNVTTNTAQAQAQIENLEGSIKVLDGAVNLVGGSLETIAGGLALTGALSKEQAEQFEQAAIGAIAFADGAKRTLDGVVNLQEGFSKLAASSKAAAVASRVLGTAIKLATGPIGIAVVAIGVIIGLLVKFKDSLGVVGDAIDFVTDGFTKLTDAIGLTNSAADDAIAKNKELADSQEFQLELLKAQGAEREKLVAKERELLKTRIKQEKDGSEEQKKAIQDLALFNAKVRGENAKAEDEAREKRQEKEKEAAKKRLEEAKAAEALYLSELQKFADAAVDLTIETAEDQLRVDRDRAIREIDQLKLSEERKTVLRLKAEEDYQAKLKKLREDKLRENAIAEFLLQAKATQTNNARLLEIQALQAETIQEKRDADLAALDAAFQAEKEVATKNKEDLLILEQLYAERKQEIIDKAAQDEKDSAQATADAVLQSRLALGQNIGAAIGQLGALFKEGTAAAKAAALAEIAINTALGFVQGLDIAQKSAKATGPGAVFAFPIFYASQIAAVLGAVASAKQVLAQTPGGSGGINASAPTATGGGSFSLGATGTSILPPTGTLPGLGGGRLGTAPTVGTVAQEPVRAYVLAGDVTNGVQANIALNNRRRLAG